MKRIIITGGDGRFAKVLKKNFSGKNIFYFSKKQFDITKIKDLEKKVKKFKPQIIIHLAALSKPLIIHEQNITKSIDINIIGTCNLVKLSNIHNIKLVYMSSHYVYPCKSGNYKETDALLPANNYSWSKLGGECAVQMYLKNSLIVRVAMYETPFIHKFGYTNIKSNFLTHQEVAKILPKIIYKKGVINLGGIKRSIYNFAKKSNSSVLPKKYKPKENLIKMMPDSSVNIKKLKSILKIKK